MKDNTIIYSKKEKEEVIVTKTNSVVSTEAELSAYDFTQVFFENEYTQDLIDSIL